MTNWALRDIIAFVAHCQAGACAEDMDLDAILAAIPEQELSEPPIIALPPRRSYPVTLDVVAIERGQPRIVEPAVIGE